MPVEQNPVGSASAAAANRPFFIQASPDLGGRPAPRRGAAKSTAGSGLQPGFHLGPAGSSNRPQPRPGCCDRESRSASGSGRGDVAAQSASSTACPRKGHAPRNSRLIRGQDELAPAEVCAASIAISVSARITVYRTRHHPAQRSTPRAFETGRPPRSLGLKSGAVAGSPAPRTPPIGGMPTRPSGQRDVEVQPCARTRSTSSRNRPEYAGVIAFPGDRDRQSCRAAFVIDRLGPVAVVHRPSRSPHPVG